MANTLTDLAADIYKAADVVSRELTGAASSVIMNGNDSDRVALNDTVRSHFTRQPSSSSAISESMTIPEGTDQTVDNKTLTIDKAQSIQIPWTGEDMKHVNNGAGFETIYGDQLAQAMRTLTNEIEVDILSEIYKNASRAVGTAGTTPFSSNFDLVAEARQVLVDNGCPSNDLYMVMNTLAGTNLRNLAQLQKANEAGGDNMLRQGVLLDLQGIALKESAGVQSHSAGSITNNVTVTGANAIGATTINVTTDASGVVSLSEGDVINIAGDSNKYVVESADAVGNSSTGDVVIQAPGLRQATSGSEAVTAESDYTGNVVFRRTAAELAMRAPAVPRGGDAADDAMTIQDPMSGLVFEVRAYKGYRKSMFEVAAAWGVKAWKQEHIGLLFG